MDYFYLYIIPVVLVIGAQILISTTYGRYKTILNKKGLTGFDVARAILDSKGLNDMMILETPGTLSDHYDPVRKVVKLSKDVFHGKSIAAVAIAAHECGHVHQDKDKYTFMKIRSAIVPFVNFSSKLGYFVLIVGFITSVFDIALIGLILLSMSLLFGIITLPVEFNASTRARETLLQLQLIEPVEANSIKAVLGAAAFTYVASVLANLLEVLRLFLIITGRRD